MHTRQALTMPLAAASRSLSGSAYLIRAPDEMSKGPRRESPRFLEQLAYQLRRVGLKHQVVSAAGVLPEGREKQKGGQPASHPFMKES